MWPPTMAAWAVCSSSSSGDLAMMMWTTMATHQVKTMYLRQESIQMDGLILLPVDVGQLDITLTEEVIANG